MKTDRKEEAPMKADGKKKTAPFNRCIGLLVLDVTMSNPNGDPDMESDPRTIDTSGKGLISPVSFKRKLRDLVEDTEGVVFQEAKQKLGLEDEPELKDKNVRRFNILESRGRIRKKILEMKEDEFKNTYWDARLFGNTFLESLKDEMQLTGQQKKRKTEGGYAHFIRTGTVQVGVGTSIAPVEIERLTMTNKSGVQEGKDRGMAPLGFRVVRHGIYIIPFYVNPTIAQKTGADSKDLELFKFLLPLAYQHTSSAIRPQVSVLHAWFAEHESPLGSCPDYLLIDALTPRLKEGVSQPESRADYIIPGDIDKDILKRFKNVMDLCDE